MPKSNKATLKQEHDFAPQYPVGTRFLRTLPGWGMCEGVVAGYDGEHYTVNYPSIKVEDEIVETKVLDDSTVTTNWNTHTLQPGQNVWACMGKGKHPAIIKTIRKSEERATVKWTTSNTVGDVDLNILFPMYDDDESGESKQPSYSRRKKMRPNYFVNTKYKPIALQKQCCKEELEVDAAFGGGIKSEDNYAKKLALKQKQYSVVKEKRKPNKKKKKPGRAPRKRKRSHDLIADTICSTSQLSDDEVPGPGWKLNGSLWVSPELELEFTPFEACKLEAYRVELGNEVEAYQKYQKYFGASSSAKPVKDEGGDNGDVNPFSPKEQKQYDMLWEFFMDPKVRMDEEIPSGMVIRKKVAQCSLLRSKCKFRHLVHKKILALNVENRKKEIFRILTQLHDHDVCSRGFSAGPSSLMKEILGESVDDEVVEVVQSSDVKNTTNAVNIEELSTDNDTTMSSLTESLPRAFYDANDTEKGNDKTAGGINNCTLMGRNRGFEDDMKLVNLLEDDSTVAKLPSSIAGGSDFNNIKAESDVFNAPTPKKLFGSGIINLLDEDEDSNSNDAPTPKRRSSMRSVIDLVDEDDDYVTPQSSNNIETASDLHTGTTTQGGIIDLTGENAAGKSHVGKESSMDMKGDYL